LRGDNGLGAVATHALSPGAAGAVLGVGELVDGFVDGGAACCVPVPRVSKTTPPSTTATAAATAKARCHAGRSIVGGIGSDGIDEDSSHGSCAWGSSSIVPPRIGGAGPARR